MVASAACREYITRFGAAFALACIIVVTAAEAQVQGPPAPRPPRDAETAVANTRELVDPVKRCRPAADGSITVCGTDTERDRLTPELRAIAGVGQSTKDSVPRAPEVKTMSLDRLPYNWTSLGGRIKPGPAYDPLFELMKRATDPETGTPAPPEEPEP